MEDSEKNHLSRSTTFPSIFPAMVEPKEYSTSGSGLSRSGHCTSGLSLTLSGPSSGGLDHTSGLGAVLVAEPGNDGRDQLRLETLEEL